jgi:hypothetical protein
MLKSAVDSIVYEVKKLVIDLEALEDLGQPLLYNISPLFELTNTVSLSTVQIEGLSTSKITALSKYDIAALSASQIAALSTVQIAALTTDQIAALTITQVAALTTAAIGALSPARIADLNPAAVARLSTTQLGAMSVAQINAMTAKQIAALTAPQVAALRVDAIPTLTSNQIVALTSSAVTGLTTAGAGALTSSQLAAMELGDVAALSPVAVRNLSDQQLNSFTTRQLAAFTLAQAAALTTTQLNSLTAPKRAALPTIPVPPAPAVPTLWKDPSTVAGNVPEIVDLSDFANNFVRANIGNAASWTISPYSFVNQGVTTYDGEGVMFTINRLSKAVSKAVLTVIYKNNAADPNRPGKDLAGNQRPYMYIRNLTGTIKGSLNVKWNGVTVLAVPTGAMPTGVIDYYPDESANFGAGGRLAPGQSTALVVELEATGATNQIKGEIFFGYYA